LSEKFNKTCLRLSDEKDKGQPIQIGGRYFAFILEEVLKKYPQLLKAVNSPFYDTFSRSAKLNFTREYEFTAPTGQEKSRADLHVSPVRGDSSLYVEIKWNDQLREGQLANYSAHVSADKNRFFSLIHLYDNLSEEESKAFKKPRHLNLSIANLLEESKKLHNKLWSKAISRKSPETSLGLLELFIDFLEDYVMEYVSEINRKALILTMKRSIGWPHQDNQQKLNTNDTLKAIPELWDILLNTLERLGQRFHDDFKRTGAYGNKPQIFYHFKSGLDKNKLEKVIQKTSGKEVILSIYGNDNEGIIQASSGVFSLYNQIWLSSTSKYYISAGFCFSCKVKKKDKSDKRTKIRTYNFVETPTVIKKSKAKDIGEGDTIKLPSEEQLYNSHLSLMDETLSEWLQDSDAPKDAKDSARKLLEVCKKRI
jgi:hypothetical protein